MQASVDPFRMPHSPRPPEMNQDATPAPSRRSSSEIARLPIIIEEEATEESDCSDDGSQGDSKEEDNVQTKNAGRPDGHNLSDSSSIGEHQNELTESREINTPEFD